jgi:hypothetical protein
MPIIAIYNVWSDSVEHLEDSISMIRNEVDFVLCVNQLVSNFGETDPTSTFVCQDLEQKKIIDSVISYAPKQKTGAKNELAKRRLGLEYAKEKGFDFFLMMDCDEFYNPQCLKSNLVFLEENADIEGLYSKILTYFKTKDLCFDGFDDYYVPFIHRLTDKTQIGTKYKVRCDPTRGVNANKVLASDCVMHHLSWVRKDIEKKIRNSSAKKNIKKSILLDYELAEDGYYVHEIFQKRLIKSDFFK